MSESNTRRYLRWYEKVGDAAIRDEDLEGINLKELQCLFNVPSDNPMYDCWEVNKEHLRVLQSHVRHSIDLEKYDYFVEASAI